MAAARLLLLLAALAGARGPPRGAPGASGDDADGPGPQALLDGAEGRGGAQGRRQGPATGTERLGEAAGPPRGGAGSGGEPPEGTPSPGGGNGSRGGREEPEGRPPGGLWPAAWGWGGPVAAMAVAYVALGAAVMAGLCQRHRALQSRARQRRRREPARRFFRVTPPSPHSPYGNVLCPTAAPRPPEPPSPTLGPPGLLWGQAPAAAAAEEEEEEGEEGYEHPDSEAEGPGEAYENEPGARSSVGSYENGLEAAGGPWGAAASHYANSRLRWQQALGERLDGRSEGSAGSQPYEDMAGGGGLYAAPRRGGGMGAEDDAGSYENMEGGRGEAPG